MILFYSPIFRVKKNPFFIFLASAFQLALCKGVMAIRVAVLKIINQS